MSGNCPKIPFRYTRGVNKALASRKLARSYRRDREADMSSPPAQKPKYKQHRRAG